MLKITELLHLKSVTGSECRDGQSSDQSRRSVKPRRALSLLVALTVICTSTSLTAQTAFASTTQADIASTVQATTTSTLVKSDYVDVGKLHMYYEIHGTVHGADKPLVLLHGGFGNIPDWGKTLTELAKSREVIAFELEGHGRTADLNRPLSWEQMTDDVAAGLKKLGFDQVDVMGYSLGAVIGLRMGVKYPSLVHKIVAISGLYSSDGYYSDISDNWPTVEQLTGTPMEKEYKQLAPNPSRWTIFAGKMVKELNDFKGWPESDLSKIKAPTLIVIGDNDAVRPEYELHLFRMLGGDKAVGGMGESVASQFAVIPNTTHMDIYTKADLIVPMINPFLDASMPK